MLKSLFTIYLLTAPVIGMAVEYDSEFTRTALEGTKPGQCVNAAGVGMAVVKAVDEHTYGVTLSAGYDVVAQGYLQTNKSKFAREGKIGYFLVKYLGTKELPTANGFKAKFGFWGECEK